MLSGSARAVVVREDMIAVVLPLLQPVAEALLEEALELPRARPRIDEAGDLSLRESEDGAPRVAVLCAVVEIAGDEDDRRERGDTVSSLRARVLPPTTRGISQAEDSIQWPGGEEASMRLRTSYYLTTAALKQRTVKKLCERVVHPAFVVGHPLNSRLWDREELCEDSLVVALALRLPDAGDQRPHDIREYVLQRQRREPRRSSSGRQRVSRPQSCCCQRKQ